MYTTQGWEFHVLHVSAMQLRELLNYFDDRIYRVSRGASVGPEYEDSRVLLDFTYEKLWSENITIKAQVKNILNDKIEYSQNGNTIESYEVGTLIKGSVSYRF